MTIENIRVHEELSNTKGFYKPEDAATLDIIKLRWYLYVLHTGIENFRMCLKVWNRGNKWVKFMITMLNNVSEKNAL